MDFACHICYCLFSSDASAHTPSHRDAHAHGHADVHADAHTCDVCSRACGEGHAFWPSRVCRCTALPFSSGRSSAAMYDRRANCARTPQSSSPSDSRSP